jgi:hypothetical protein
MNKTICLGSLVVTVFMIMAATIVPNGFVYACGKCWNVTAGEPLEVIGVDLTGDDAGYAIKMDCTVDEKPDPPGSPLHLTCTEKPIGNYSRTG